MIYRLILYIRNAFYNSGKHSVKAEVPTICVGNVTVGGTGKTPHTEMILRILKEDDIWGGRNLAVLSRGYKRRSTGFQQVAFGGSAKVYGDEPLQIKKKFPEVTVAVDKDRIEGCRILRNPGLLENKKYRHCRNKGFPAADIIILDDCYQYRKLKATLNIVLVDYYRPVTSDKLLPLGSLRDLPGRMYDSEIVIVSKCPYVLDTDEKKEMAATLGYRSYDPDTCLAIGPSGQRQHLFFTMTSYGQPVPMFKTSDPRFIYSKKLILFTGIAKDAPLKAYLSDNYKIVAHLPFPDHHRYTGSDFSRIRAELKHNPTAAIATTEKDAQRVMDVNTLPQQLRERMFYVPISAEFLTENEKELFTREITQIY